MEMKKAQTTKAPATTKATKKKAAHDVVLIGSRTEDGQGVRALRSRPGRVELAELRPAKEGQPLNAGELVSLRQRKEHPALWDVDVQYNGREDSNTAYGDSSHAGPPRVATDRYRRNWDSVFGGPSRRKRGNALPN